MGHLMMATLEMETCVRGFHVYKAMWGQLSEKNWSVGEREATEWIATLWQ